MFFRKRSFIAVFLVLLVLGVLTYQSLQGKSRFLDLPVYPISLIMQANSAVIKGVGRFVSSYLLIVGKEEENRRLLDRIVRLESELNRNIEAVHENRRLRKFLDLKAERNDFVLVAEVFARDPTNWFQVLWIDKGSDDGILKDMIAVTPSGPVGKVHNVFRSKASIILLTDVNSSVAVRIQPSRIDGILEGGGGKNCFLKYVSQDADIENGQRIITSGLDGIYPEGLLIGRITKVSRKSGELFLGLEVKPAQNFNTVEEVIILRR